MGNVEIESTLQ